MAEIKASTGENADIVIVAEAAEIKTPGGETLSRAILISRNSILLYRPTT